MIGLIIFPFPSPPFLSFFFFSMQCCNYTCMNFHVWAWSNLSFSPLPPSLPSRDLIGSRELSSHPGQRLTHTQTELLTNKDHHNYYITFFYNYIYIYNYIYNIACVKIYSYIIIIIYCIYIIITVCYYIYINYIHYIGVYSMLIIQSK